ncbi:MAG TPA: hypothetical protein VFN07_01145 [Trueperaceae bacterium]|nr:hypothetical protein [Trueperaceae bacterium]HRP46082.1 hypothetical protein [Trueperaceae bacterium]
MDVNFKLVTSNSVEHFERRLNEFVAGLDRNDVVVDVKFSTATYGEGVEFSALVQYQTTSEWHE